MSRKLLVPFQLPADPTLALEAATKQYVDARAGSEVEISATDPIGTNANAELWIDTTVTPGFPASYPRGLVAPPVTSTAGISGVGATFADIPGLSITWTAVATRYYLTVLTVQLIQNTSAGYVSLVITDAANTILKTAVWYATVPGESRITLPLWEYGISGTTVRKARINTSVGTVNVFIGSGNRDAQMLVQDVGG